MLGRLEPVPDGLDAVLRTGDGRRLRVGGRAGARLAGRGWRCRRHADPAHVRASGGASTRRAVPRRDNSRWRRPPASTRTAACARSTRPTPRASMAATRPSTTSSSCVASNPFVTVVGSSGSGKSSVVHAGLVPRLRSGGDAVVTMIPGDDPVAAMRAALDEMATSADVDGSNDPADVLADIARRFGRAVLVIDQFEECWTRAPAERRDSFLAIVALSPSTSGRSTCASSPPCAPTCSTARWSIR